MKHVHSQNTTLCDVTRMSGDHYARQTSHYLVLRDGLIIFNKNLLYVTRNLQKYRTVSRLTGRVAGRAQVWSSGQERESKKC
ncbi:MAG: hypothetical protein AB1733_06350 [Thermodesulfobacteriota bacterium]